MGGHSIITIKTDNQNIRKQDGEQNIWSHKRRSLENENQKGDEECTMRCSYHKICKIPSTRMI
jgi:cell shape-determining protein MreC